MKVPFKLILFLLCLTQISFAHAKTFSYPTKSKTITKEFAVTNTALMEVKNSYGNITVILWDENKINYDVNITVGARNEKLTQELLDAITVKFSSSTTNTNATTVFPKTMSGNREIEVNYTIKIPRNAQVNVDQKYGNIYIPELNGSLNLTNKYGDFTLGSLKSKTNTFDVAYVGSGKAEFINYATFNVRYSTLNIEKINYFVANGNYNTFKINNAGTFNFETSYTNITCEKVQKLDIKGNYLNLKFNEVGVSSIIKSNYTTVSQNLTNNTEFVEYNGNYATININNLNQLKFNFNVKGSYLSLNSKINLNYSIKNTDKKPYEFVGSTPEKGNLKINITSNYGTVNFKN